MLVQRPIIAEFGNNFDRPRRLPTTPGFRGASKNIWNSTDRPSSLVVFRKGIRDMEAPETTEKQPEQRRMEVKGGGFSIINPATGEKVGEYPLMGPEEVAGVIGQARRAFPSWSKTPFSTRAKIFRRAAGYLAENAEKYARIVC